jgi:hypothetical protein
MFMLENSQYDFLKFCYYNLISLGIINICDYSIIYYNETKLKKKNKYGRWFMLHFIINVFITLLTFEDVKDSFFNPDESNKPFTYYISGCLAFSLHLYHTLRFNLTQLDIYHHMISCFLCTPLCYLYQTKGLSCYLFFCTGLPGGIDYLLLYMVKNKYIISLTEKRINSYLNTYIRMPGGVVTSYLVFKDANIIYQNSFLSLFIYTFSYLVFLNATFFGKLSIENYTENKKLLEQKKEL